MEVGKISSAGLGSGLDVAGIVSKLMTLERKPLDLLAETKSKVDTQLSGLGKLQSSLSAVRDAARALTTASTWSPTTVSSSEPTMVNASSTGTTPAGGYTVEVSKLAKAQSVTSVTIPRPNTVVGTGTLNIEIGQWFTDPPDFTPNAGTSSVSIAITEEDNTLEKIRNKINEADAGVVASIVNDSSGARLSIRSSETGETNAFRISVTDSDGGNADATGLSMLAYDANATSNPMKRTVAASNAELTINNIPISSASNTLTNVLDGLSVTLSRVTTAPVELSVNRDTAAVKKSITDFAESYNNLVKLMREQTAYNETSKTGGALQGDRTAVGLQNKLRSVIGGSSGASTEFTRLADVGLEPQRDGTLKVNSTKLDAAVGRLADLKNFFSRDEEGTASDGFGTMLRQFADLQLASDGQLTTRTEGMQDRLKTIKDRTGVLEDRMVQTEKRLREQYTRLDSTMASLNGLQAYVTQQVARWNA